MANIGTIGGDDFLIHVTRVRSEIRDKFLKAHNMLQDRETDLLDKLQELEEDFIGNVITKQIEELNRSKDALMNTLRGNSNKYVLDQHLANIDAQIDELIQKFHTAKYTYKSVTLEWDVELEDILSVAGYILLKYVTEVRDYKRVKMPVATIGKHCNKKSYSPGVFDSPTGLTIDPTTNYLYICDQRNDRVQVFNRSSRFISELSDKMDKPSGICISRNKVYVTQCGSSLLTVYSPNGKCLQSVGGEGKNHLEFHEPRGLDISTKLNRIFIAEHGNDRIHCLNLDLSFHSIIEDIHAARDVKLTPVDIVLLSGQNPCLSIYSYSHQLIRVMISYGETFQLKLPARFILDNCSNILITDFISHCVCVYSYRGEFLHKFGKEGNQKGDFIHPRGITISPLGRIVIASDNPNHPLQIF